MRKSVLVLVGVAVAIVVIGFIITRRSEPNPTPTEPFAETRQEGAHPGTGSCNFTPHPPRTRPRTNDPLVPSSTPPVPATSSATVMTNWEERLDAILTSDKPDPDKAKEMIQMFPKLSPEEQEEIEHHI
jgi:hypothetical protein